MSNPEKNPVEVICKSRRQPATDSETHGRAAVEIISSRVVPLGGPRAMNVRRTLPQRQRSLIGAWCFIDHYGPDDVATSGGMDVAPHPHTGLQTVSWLFSGAVSHIDSGGNSGLVLPGEVNLMTAGRGICHSEVSTTDTSELHGVQLWLALPDAVRNTPERRFEHFAPPNIEFEGGSALVFLGSLLGSKSPLKVHSPLVGAQLQLDAGATIELQVDPSFEHGLLVDSGVVYLENVLVPMNALGYTGVGSSTLKISNTSESQARLMLVGGAPFEEEIIMWWNFVGRNSDEITRFREEWNNEDERFGQVAGYVGHGGPGRNIQGLSRLPAPTMPNVRLRPRKSPPAHAQQTNGQIVKKAQGGNVKTLQDKTGAVVSVSADKARSAYVIEFADGTIAGRAYYVNSPEKKNERIFYHTVIDEKWRGRGLAGLLLQQVLTKSIANAFTIVPVCPVFVNHLRDHGGAFEVAGGSFRQATGADIEIAQSADSHA